MPSIQTPALWAECSQWLHRRSMRELDATKDLCSDLTLSLPPRAIPSVQGLARGSTLESEAIMSPVGGAPGRRLRGAPGGVQYFVVTCTCGNEYKIAVSALDFGRCKKCKKETRTLPAIG